MSGTSPKNPSVRFGVFEANFASQELRKHGTRVRLRGQSLALLQMLVTKHGEIVTREEMKNKLWPADTFVDFENGLNAAIKKLRAVLGDSPDNPRYIETIPKAGYRFIAPVRLVESDAEETRFSASAPVAPPVEISSALPVGRARRLPARLLVFAAILVVVAGGAWMAARPVADPRVLRGAALTTSARVDAYGRIQTDGARLFFLERHGDHWTLMQMSASGGEVQPFANPFENTKLLAVSADGSEMLIAPFTQREQPLAIWMMPGVGGAPRRLGAVTASDAVFTSDGTKITYATREGIYVVGRDGLNPQQLAKVDGEKSALGWSPDGSMLRFQMFAEERTVSKIWEVRADGSQMHELLPGWEKQPSQCCGRWSADGRYYLFTAFDASGKRTIWALREGPRLFGKAEVPVALTSGPVSMDEPLPSRDAAHLFTLGNAQRFEYVRYDPVSKDTRGLLAGAGAAWATMSADGKWMAYHLGGALWRSGLDGSDKKELAPATLQPSLPAISPDGKTLVFRGVEQGESIGKIFAVPADGGAPSELISGKYSASAPTWSADGSEIVYSMASEAGAEAGLHRFNMKNRTEEKFAGGEGFWKCKWSPDGRYLAAIAEDERRIGLFDAATKKWRYVATAHTLSPVAWSGDANYLFYQDLLEAGEPVHRLRIRDGKMEQLDACRALLEGGVQRCGFEGVTPDGGLILRLSRGDREVYSLDMELP